MELTDSYRGGRRSEQHSVWLSENNTNVWMMWSVSSDGQNKTGAGRSSSVRLTDDDWWLNFDADNHLAHSLNLHNTAIFKKTWEIRGLQVLRCFFFDHPCRFGQYNQFAVAPSCPSPLGVKTNNLPGWRESSVTWVIKLTETQHPGTQLPKAFALFLIMPQRGENTLCVVAATKWADTLWGTVPAGSSLARYYLALTWR